MKKWQLVMTGLVAIAVVFVGAKFVFAQVLIPSQGVFGRQYNNGYLTGAGEQAEDWIFVPFAGSNYDGLGPGCATDTCTVSLASFLQNYHDRLTSASFVNRGRTAAEIDVMLGQQGPSFGTIQSGINYAVAHYQQWVNLVTLYASGTVPGYSVQWNANIDFSTFSMNGMGMTTNPSTFGEDCTHNQGCIGDITFAFPYDDPGFNHAVVFTYPGGKFYIKHKCGNLSGDTAGLAVPPTPNYKLKPTVNVTVNGKPATTAQVGDTIKFAYSVDNTGTDDSPATTCTNFTPPKIVAGDYTIPDPEDEGTNNFTCGGFTAGKTVTVGTATTYVPTGGNETVCDSLYVAAATSGGGPASDEACVTVAAEPYAKVFGGDVSAGDGLANATGTCTDTGDASIVGWNEGASAYDGTGTQYAAYAMQEIYGFASAQSGNGASTAAAPSDLSFANTSVNEAGGDYGGGYGSLPCISDYYGTKPATTIPIHGSSVDVGTLASGAYSATGPLTITGGTINPGVRIQLYVEGSVYIDGNITYGGSWSAANTPLFELIAGGTGSQPGGNIYIAGGAAGPATVVSQLDGVYIAQENGGNDGLIATCANAAGTGPAAADDTLYANCDNKLTVNGDFVANEIELLRTTGTVSDAGSDDPGTLSSPNSAEQFNFNPSLWIAQPPQTTGQTVSPNYDAIVSLPPVL
jgi:uncharacterized repeat protein (TIGR01451 family)